MAFSLKNFNQRQKDAITHDSRPLLVISGAGTGKTHVIVGRILHLILEKNVPAGEILALTFNEKASQEMQNRVEDALPLGHPEVCLKTFHGFCETVLREKAFEIGLDPTYKLLTPVDVWLFLKRHALDLKLEYFRSLGNPQKFLSILQDHFSRLQDEDITPEEYLRYSKNLKNFSVQNSFFLAASAQRERENRSEGVPLSGTTEKRFSPTKIEKEIAGKTQELARAYEIYENLLVTNGLMDFSGLIFYTLRLFEKRHSALKEYQERFRYILVDEFQDTNFAQNKLITLLAQKHKNLFVVGDDDQSIYKWRGASLTNIEYFNKLFPKAKKIVLNENYRSTEAILDAAYAVIQKNNPRRLEITESLDKRLISVGNFPKQQLPEIFHFETLDEEVRHVCMKAHACLKKGMNTAILVRTNALAKPFVEGLKQILAPLQHFSESDLFNKPSVKDSIALLRVLTNPWDDIPLFRLLSLPFWKIPMEKLLELNKEAKGKNVPLFDMLQNPPFLKIKTLLQDLIEYSRGQSVSRVIGTFLKESKYLNFASAESDNLARFSEKVSQFEASNEYTRVSDFVTYFELLEERGDFNSDQIALDPSAIKILTIHSAKGLEFDAVFVPGMVQNKFPSVSRRDPLQIPQELLQETLPPGDHHVEEERRLFYVACTRARELLTLSYSDFYESHRQGVAGKKQWKESLFLAEMLQSGKANLRNLAKKSKKKLQQSLLPLSDRSHRSLTVSIPKLSFSQISTFRTCPLKYQFRYLFELPAPPSPQMNFGISLHNVLKDFYLYLQKNPSEREKNLLPRIQQLYDTHWISSGYSTRALQEDQKRRGLGLLERFYQHEKARMVIPTFIEKQFVLKLPEVTLRGRIDRIDQLEDSTFEVIDYKTGENREKNLKHDLQLSLYALACKEVFKIPVSRLSLYYLDGPEKISTTRSAQELEACRREIIECAKELAASDFSPTPGYHCNYCDYRLICPVAAPMQKGK